MSIIGLALLAFSGTSLSSYTPLLKGVQENRVDGEATSPSAGVASLGGGWSVNDTATLRGTSHSVAERSVT
jgi:hypothetical protein